MSWSVEVRRGRMALAGSLLLVQLAGCVSGPPARQVQDHTAAAVREATGVAVPQYGLKHVASVADLPGGFAERVPQGGERGDVSITASGRLQTILRAIAGDRYAVSFVDGIDADRLAMVSVRNMSVDAAVRQVAVNAGYVAVTDQEAHSITISDQAEWTFRIPVRLMQQLSTEYGIDGSGSAGSTLGAGGMPGAMGGSSMSGTMSGASGSTSTGSVGSVQATFTASSKMAQATGMKMHGGIDEFLQSIAGQNAWVAVSRDTGYVTVRGNGAALSRMHRFLNQFVYDNDRRVDIKVSVIEVSLDDSMSYGIDWSRVLSPLQNSHAALSLSGGASSISNPSLTFNFTTASISSVISALRNYARVSVLTQPSLTAMNRSPVAIFDGTSVPYLGSIMTTATLSATSTGASTSFAESGVSLSVMPDILSDTEAQITLAPTVSAIQSMQDFTVSGSTLEAPQETEKRVLMQTIVRNGETVIVGGIRTGTDNNTTTTLPFVKVPLGGNGDQSSGEVVILLQSTVIPPRHVDTLVAESL